MPSKADDNYVFMQAAIKQANKSRLEKGIPIGSVLVRSGRIIGRGHNKRVQDGDPTAHAEIDCLRNAGRIGNYNDTILFSTLQPCQLCTGAVLLFGIPRVVVGECETFPGAADHLISQGVEVINLNLEECKQMMREFIAENSKLWNEDIGK
jgi:cytosine/creatinine deaminase